MLNNSITDNIITLSNQYEATDKTIIKKNITKQISLSNYNRNTKILADLLQVDIQTIYSYRKPTGNIPSFIIALKLCKALNITIEELIKE